MQASTHIITGVLLQKVFKRIPSRSVQYSVLAMTGILSHGILDRLARLTYHPPDPLWRDWFWVTFHVGVAVLTVYYLRRYWKRYKFGILFAVLPDLDWLILKPARTLTANPTLWQDKNLHQLVYSFMDAIPLLNNLAALPDHNLERSGAAIEIILLTALTALAFWHDDRWCDRVFSDLPLPG